MKNLVLLALFSFIFMSYSNAQIETPRPSPMCKLEQMVGLTEVTLEFSRPGVKGRELFVDVESFGNIWRTGANASTKISFSEDVMIEGNEIPAGKYAIYSIPDPKEWTIMLYKDLTLGGYVDNYDQGKEVIRFKAKAQMLNQPMESFMVLVDKIKSDGAEVALVWGKYYVPFQLEVNTDETVMKSIEKVMNGPSADDYYAAASYYFEEGKDIKKALEWAKKANNVKEPRYWRVRLEARLLAATGEYEEAIAKINKSSELAKSAGNDGYAEANKKYIAEWNANKD